MKATANNTLIRLILSNLSGKSNFISAAEIKNEIDARLDDGMVRDYLMQLTNSGLLEKQNEFLFRLTDKGRETVKRSSLTNPSVIK